MVQTTIAIGLLIAALVYVFRKFWPRKKSSKSCGSDSCGCH
ncbi:MAG: FeoB-associated Cys-rich membrane protein [Flavobacterium sp.]|nr:FeoB-associated Cys-rich membrane protein [Flavobacterium sp.]